MEHELLKALAWETYRQGVISKEDLEHDLELIEGNQMASITSEPHKVLEQVLRLPKWRMN